MECLLDIGLDEVPFIKTGDDVLRLEIEMFDGEFLKIAEIEARETQENKDRGLKELRDILKGEPELNFPADEEQLLKFLRPSKFYPDNAFKMMSRFYKFKERNPKYCADITPQEVRLVYEDGILEFISTRCSKGERVLVYNLEKWNTKTVALKDILRATILAVEIPMLEPKTQVAGVHAILNTKGLCFSHIREFSPRLAQLILEFVQHALPIHLKTINIVNQPRIFNMLYAIFRPFIGEELRKKLFFHGTDWEALHKVIPKENLTNEYGGPVQNFSPNLLADLLEMYGKQLGMLLSFGYATKKGSH